MKLNLSKAPPKAKGKLPSGACKTPQRRQPYPVYLVCGFLDSGKTHFCKNYLSASADPGCWRLFLQFELGDEPAAPLPPNCLGLALGRQRLLNEGAKCKAEIAAALAQLEEAAPASARLEIWLEWNGSWSFSQLRQLFFAPSQPATPPADPLAAQLLAPSTKSSNTAVALPFLGDLCYLQKLIFVAASHSLPALLKQEGSPLPPFIAQADLLLLRPTGELEDARKLLEAGRAPEAALITELDQQTQIQKLIGKAKPKPLYPLLLPLFFMAALYALTALSGGLAARSFNQFSLRSLAIFLQALPYLILGVLLSSALQTLLPANFVQKYFPKNRWGGLAFALLGGFLLPVCDCASVPVFRALVKKGVPLPAALTFLLAAPVLNPVVIISTHAAFPDLPQLLYLRLGLGLLVALTTGLSFSFGAQPFLGSAGTAEFACACGCDENSGALPGYWQKILFFLRHSTGELFKVGCFLLVGVMLSALFQTFVALSGWQSQVAQGLTGILIMLGLAFLLSLCSSSDAVVARSYLGSFAPAALLAFLVFGPMIDLKNVAMLSASCSKSFVLRLALSTLACTLFYVLLCQGLGLLN